MKRAFGMLIVCTALLTVACVASYVYVHTTSARLQERVSKVLDALAAADTPKAESELSAFEEDWTAIFPVWEVLMKHQEVDATAASVQRARALCHVGDVRGAYVECTLLLHKLQHIPHAETLRLEGLL